MSLVSSKKRIHIPTNVHNPTFLRSRNTTLYEPCMDQKGIHCEGDHFGYVVDWEISEKKNEKDQVG